LKKNIFILSVLLCCVIHPIFSQALREHISAAYVGLASYSNEHTDAFSFTNNQASLVKAKATETGIYSERRFLLKETTVYDASVVLPSKSGNFGVNLVYSGFKDFTEMQFGVAYAKSLSPKLDVGVQFNYYGYQIPTYSNNNTVDFEIGAIAHLTNKLNAGFHVYNPVGGKFFKSNEKLAAVYKFGFGYDVSDVFYASAEIVKEENFPSSINAGLQYRFAKQLFARVGIVSATSTPYTGVGVAWDNFRIDISCSFHPQLGISPGLLFIINFDKGKDE
jgi:hypothetical protein